MELLQPLLEKYGALIAASSLILLSGAVGILGFMLKRYISARDEFEAAANKRFEEQSKKFETLAANLSANSSHIREDALRIRELQVGFKECITEELKKVRSVSTDYYRHLKSVSEYLTNLEKKVDGTIKRLETCLARDQVQENAIRGTLDALKAFRKDFFDYQEDVQTTITEIAPGVARIGQKNRPRKA